MKSKKKRKRSRYKGGQLETVRSIIFEILERRFCSAVRTTKQSMRGYMKFMIFRKT